MVRKLIAATDRAIDMMPADALEITRIAVEIAEGLLIEDSQTTFVVRLRFASLLERAYALMCTGAYAEAMATLAKADAIGPMIGSEFDRARLDLVRVLVYRSLERRDEALLFSHAAGPVFAEYDAVGRYAADPYA